MSEKDWLRDLLLNNSHSDVVLVLNYENNLEVPAHSLVLKAHSEVFGRMLDQDKFQEGATKKILLCDVEYSVAKLFLGFMYSEEIPDVSLNVHIQLLQVAHFYQVKALVKICVCRISPKLTSDNACELLDTLALYSEILKVACGKVIARYAFLIFRQERHLCLSNESLDFLLRDKSMYLLSEDQVVLALLRWGENLCGARGVSPDLANMKEKIGDLLKLVKWRQISCISKFAPHTELLSHFKSKTGGIRPTLNIAESKLFLKDSNKISFQFFDGQTRYEMAAIEIVNQIFKKPLILVGIKVQVESEKSDFHFQILSDLCLVPYNSTYSVIIERAENEKRTFLREYQLIPKSPVIIHCALQIKLIVRKPPLPVLRLQKGFIKNQPCDLINNCSTSVASGLKTIYFLYPS